MQPRRHVTRRFVRSQESKGFLTGSQDSTNPAILGWTSWDDEDGTVDDDDALSSEQALSNAGCALWLALIRRMRYLTGPYILRFGQIAADTTIQRSRRSGAKSVSSRCSLLSCVCYHKWMCLNPPIFFVPGWFSRVDIRPTNTRNAVTTHFCRRSIGSVRL